jgi:glyoxylase-like metal-dependent hydrolase (beta-lactamase superfamily II)
MSPARLALLLLTLCCGGCAIVYPAAGTSVGTQGDARIGQYVTSDWYLEGASYWIEGPEGLVLIDTQIVPTATRKVVNDAEWRTGKKVKLAIVLHPSPDRFNGTGWLVEKGIRVVTSEQVREAIPAAHRRWLPVYGARYERGLYPKEAVLPESFGESTRVLSAAGLTLKAHVLGAGCGPAHVVIEWEGHLFTGDLVSHGAHGGFDGGSTEAWLQRLDELRALNPKWIHPGHGTAGGLELLERQAAFLKDVVDTVAAEKPRGLSGEHPDALGRIADMLAQRHPHHHRGFLLPLLRAEWGRQVTRSVAAP